MSCVSGRAQRARVARGDVRDGTHSTFAVLGPKPGHARVELVAVDPAAALLRPDVMPKGDIALHAAYHKLTGEPRRTSDEFIQISEQWRPYRSVAARLLWHFYLSERKNGTRMTRKKRMGTDETKAA